MSKRLQPALEVAFLAVMPLELVLEMVLCVAEGWPKKKKKLLALWDMRATIRWFFACLTISRAFHALAVQEAVWERLFEASMAFLDRISYDDRCTVGSYYDRETVFNIDHGHLVLHGEKEEDEDEEENDEENEEMEGNEKKERKNPGTFRELVQALDCALFLEECIRDVQESIRLDYSTEAVAFFVEPAVDDLNDAYFAVGGKDLYSDSQSIEDCLRYLFSLDDRVEDDDSLDEERAGDVKQLKADLVAFPFPLLYVRNTATTFDQAISVLYFRVGHAFGCVFVYQSTY